MQHQAILCKTGEHKEEAGQHLGVRIGSWGEDWASDGGKGPEERIKSKREDRVMEGG